VANLAGVNQVYVLEACLKDEKHIRYLLIANYSSRSKVYAKLFSQLNHVRRIGCWLGWKKKIKFNVFEGWLWQI